MTAYQNARAATPPQKGLTYSELLLDNIIGLDNDYLSAGERLGQAFNADEIGFLKNAGISAYEGAKQAVTQPLTTAEELLSGLYDSGANVASTLGPDPTYLNDALQEMYGVTYDEATDEQVTAAREALFGDVLNVASVVPAVKGAKMVADPIDAAIDRANLEEAIKFRVENASEYDPSALAGRRMYVPDIYERAGMYGGFATPGQKAYMDSISDADYLESLGYSPEAVSNATGILDIPMRRVGEDDPAPNLRVAAVPEEIFDAYRTRKPDVDVKFYDPPRRVFGLLPSKELGYADRKRDASGFPIPGEYEIAISNSARDPALKQMVYDHEMGHIDLEEGDVMDDAIGGDPDNLNRDRIYSLRVLTNMMKTATPEERALLGDLKREIQEMTPLELYFNNPGEMLARLTSEERPFSIKRLTARQALNPYLNQKSLPERLVDSGLTSLLSDTRPYMAPAQRLVDRTPLLQKIRFPKRGYDVHETVPMDLSDSVLPPRWGRADSDYAKGGIVKGSYLDNDPYD
jgi:hypothetical protein